MYVNVKIPLYHYTHNNYAKLETNMFLNNTFNVM